MFRSSITRLKLAVTSKNQQLFTMNILPEEDITGFLVRQSFERSQGRVLMRGDSGAVNTERPGWAFPSGLISLVAELSAGLPDIDGVLNGHTRLPLHAPFLAPADQGALRDHYKGRAMKGIAARVGMINRGLRSRMAVCPDCLQIDSKLNGYAIWRRLHLMPGILACPLHERPLLTFCHSCESGHRCMRTNWRPGPRCVCGDSLKPVEHLETKELEVAIGIANMADQILRGPTNTEVSATAVTAALTHFFGGRGRDARVRLTEAINHSVGLRSVSLLGIGARTIERLLGCLVAYGPIRNPIQNLAAIYAVFGGLGGFAALSEVGKQPAMNAPVEMEVIDIKSLKRKNCRRLKGPKYLQWVAELPGEERATLKIASRRWLLNLIQEHPGIGRSALWRKPGNYSALRYLRHFDSEWFDDLLPVAQRWQQRVTNELTHLDEVERLKEYIKQRYELSLRVRPWQRITKTFLLTGAASESSSNLVMESNEIKSILDSYVETPARRLGRLTEMICGEVGRRFPGHQFGNKTTYSCLTDRGCARRINKAKKWLTQNGS